MSNITLKKSLMAAATGAALAVISMTPASAESLLFPYWTTTNGTTAVLSLSAGADFTANKVHFVWNYGPSCTHFDNYGAMTANDLNQQFLIGSGTLFGDKSTPAYFPTLKDPTQQFGFLIVSDSTTAGGVTGPADSLRGQMVLASPTTGMVTSYAGIPSNGGVNEGNFSNLNATGYQLSFYPTSAVQQTQWFAVVTGDESGAIAAGSNWTGAASYKNVGTNVYGRDEDAYSGTTSGSLTCSGYLNPSSFMNSAQQASVTNGGIINAAFTPTAPATGVLLTKLETTNALSSGGNVVVTPEKATTGQGW